MRSRTLSALSAIAVLSVVGVSLPTGTAAADTDCRPTFDTGSLVAQRKVRLPVNGSTYLRFEGSFTAPCGPFEADAFEGGVLYGHEDSDEPFVFDATKIIKPTDQNDRFSFAGDDKLSAKTLRNSDAGTWISVYVIGKAHSSSDDDFDVVDGPTISVKREAHLTAKASATEVKKGKKITITGTLTRANWNTRRNDVLGGQTVQIQFRAGQGTYATIATVKSSSKGVVKATVKPSVDGAFRFNYVGTSTTSYDKSSGIRIDVR